MARLMQDSPIPTLPAAFPNISSSEAEELDNRLKPRDTISVIFLLLDDYAQAYSFCSSIEEGKNPFGDAPGIISLLVDHIREANMHNGYIKIYCALHLLQRYRTLRQALNVKKKNLESFFSDREYHFIPSIRVSLFKLCQRWQRSEWTRIMDCIRFLNNLGPEEMRHEEIETNLIEMFVKRIIVCDGANPQFKSTVESITPQLIGYWSEVEPIKVPVLPEDHFPTKRGGFVLVINQEKYVTPEFSERRGTSYDVQSIKRTFHKFGCIVNVKSDLTGSQILDTVVKHVNTTDYTNYDYFVLFLLGHGALGSTNGRDVFFGVDGDPICVESIRDPFIDVRKCRTLAGKPKLFFVQACRGTREMDTVPICHDGPRIAEIDGCFMFKCTWPGFVAYKDALRGSFFIQYLCREIDEFGGKKSLNDHCDAVEEHLRTCNMPYVQIAVYENSLGKRKFYFTRQITQ